MNRVVKIMIGTLVAMIAMGAFCSVVLYYFDWNRARPLLNERIAGRLGRPFSINGDLSLNWSREGAETDWRRWAPWPHLIAHDVVIGNPEWTNKGKSGEGKNSDDHLGMVKQISFSLDPLALFKMKIIIPALVLEAPSLSLQRQIDGKNNWTIDFGSGPSLWKVELHRLVVTNGTVQLDDAVRKIKLSGWVETVDGGGKEGYGMNWKVNGRFNGAELDGSGQAGAALSLQTQSTPYPLRADIHVGKTHIGIKGTLTKPSDLAALDLRLALSGASMGDLYPLTGIAMPETPPYDTEGHLIGKLSKQGSDWIYEKFEGKVGSSDLSGSLEYRSQQPPFRPRPLLKGAVVSNLLRFQDLAPIIGADSNASKINRGAPPAQTADKILPIERFKFERWRTIDADVQFTGRKLIRNENLPLDNLVTHIYLQDGLLSLRPLEFEVAGGSLVSNIKLDGNGALIKAQVDASARHIKLSRLSPDFKPMQTSLGEINGDAKLSAIGDSVASLMGASNGEIKTFIKQGTVSKLLLDEAGLNVLNILMTKLFGDKQIELNCVAGDFSVDNGLMQARNFLIDTDEASVTVNGQVNLANEHLNLIVTPENKKFRLVSFRTPVYIGGTFKDPAVSLNKGVLAMRAGGALALGLLTPFAALLPLVDVGPGKESACARLLIQQQTKPQAPPPGKMKAAKAADNIQTR